MGKEYTVLKFYDQAQSQARIDELEAALQKAKEDFLVAIASVLRQLDAVLYREG